MSKTYCVYIMANERNTTLYIGATSDIARRVWEHKNKATEGFTEKYKISKLVYVETHEDPESAIQREKRLKEWKRQWKVELIEKENPAWKDLSEDMG